MCVFIETPFFILHSLPIIYRASKMPAITLSNFKAIAEQIFRSREFWGGDLGASGNQFTFDTEGSDLKSSPVKRLLG